MKNEKQGRNNGSENEENELEQAQLSFSETRESNKKRTLFLASSMAASTSSSIVAGNISTAGLEKEEEEQQADNTRMYFVPGFSDIKTND